MDNPGALFKAGDVGTPNIRVWRIIFDEQPWMLDAVLKAFSLLTDPNNWSTDGTATPEDGSDNGIGVVLDFFPTVDLLGTVLPFAGQDSAIPYGYLKCDGTIYANTDWPDLAAILGTTYGGDGTHFGVPDLRSRVPVGTGTGTGLSTYTLGETVGEETHQLTAAEMPSHTHSYVPAAATAIPVGVGVPAPSAIPGISITGSTGGDGSHNNIQPSFGLTYLIVAVHG